MPIAARAAGPIRPAQPQVDRHCVRFLRVLCFATAGSLGWGLALLLAWAGLVSRVGDGWIAAAFLSLLSALLVVVLPSTRQRWSTYISYLNEARFGTAELLAGIVPAGPTVPGRVVRIAVLKDAVPFGVLGVSAHPIPYQAMMEVLPPDGPPRRVSVFAPAGPGELVSGAAHAVALHPTRPDIGILDGRLSQHEQRAFAQDPRWSTAELPTDRSYQGGRSGRFWLCVCGLAGLATTTGLGLVVIALVGTI